MYHNNYKPSWYGDSDTWGCILFAFAIIYVIAIIGASIWSYIVRGDLLGSLLLLVTGIIGVPMALFFLGGLVLVFAMAIYNGYAYMRKNKDKISLHWILLGLVGIIFGGYFAFCLLTDNVLFKYGYVYYPYESRGYYHADDECHYLLAEDEENYCPDYCGHMLLIAQLHGYEPCHDCIDPDKEYGSRTISIICYIIFLASIIGYCEYKARKEETA